VVALPPHNPPDHHAPDSERLLRTFGTWHREWDESPIHADSPADRDEQIKFAIQQYANGLLPIQVRWALAEQFGRDCQITRVQKAAERTIQAQQQQPPELRRALVAIQRQRAIQGAIQAGMWGPALAGLARAGDVAGELAGDAGLSPDDLRLVVAIEGDDAMPLPAGQGEPLAAETGETGETGETEAVDADAA
jgi:hypothetical protein